MKLNKLQIYVIAILILLVGIHVVPFAEEIPRVGPLIKGVKHVTKPVTKAITKFFHRGEIEAFHKVFPKSLEKAIQKIKDNPLRYEFGTIETVHWVKDGGVMIINNGNSTPYEVKFQPNDDEQRLDFYIKNLGPKSIPYQNLINGSDDKLAETLTDLVKDLIKIHQRIKHIFEKALI